MNRNLHHRLFRSGQSHWAVLAFMVGFAAIVIIVANFYLIPAMAASQGATDKEKRLLVSFSRLLLAIVLFILFSGLLLTFRVGRFFFPRANAPRTRTKYVDVWAEAGKRLAAPDEPNEPHQ